MAIVRIFYSFLYLVGYVVCAGIFSGTAGALSVFGDLEQGSLIYFRVAPLSTIVVDKEEIPVSALGIAPYAISRNYQGSLNIKVRYGKKESLFSLEVIKRQWNIEKVTLPNAKKYEEYPPELLKKIKEEGSQIKQVRQLYFSEEYLFQGFKNPLRHQPYRISGVFGSRRIYNGHERSYHKGVDYAAPVGTPVYTVAKGRVVLAEKDMFFTGGTVIIDHGFGVQSLYAHLYQVDVAANSLVSMDQKIGEIGATGRATGPHLHFSISWKGVYVDPESVLRNFVP